VTDGSEGAFAAAGDRLYYCPVQEAVVAGTAGAGDAFASTFTAYRAGGNSLEDALRAASVNAASVLAHVDTQTGLMPRVALEAALYSGLERKKPTLNVISWPL
jgi:sugar/nucleoside kinase (ribokinase family)